MKKFIVIFFMLAAVKSYCQDRIAYFTSAEIAYLHTVLTGPLDISDGHEINGIKVNPDYQYQEKTYAGGQLSILFGMNLPFVKKENWSIGTKLSAGISFLSAYNEIEMLKGIWFTFPEYIYYRNYKHNFDYSFLVGYKYAYGNIPYALPMAAFEVRIRDWALRIYGSLDSQKYYVSYNDGTTSEGFRMSEYGVLISQYF